MNRLANQPWLTSPAATRVMDALDKVRPGSGRFVGGCVRNALLNEPVADFDIATQLTPDQVEQAMRAANIAVHPTGIEHGTLTVVADHQPFEVTTLRQDVETDGRRATVAFTEDWAIDAQRRDFRMNALYADRAGTVYDPTGGGLDDIRDRCIVFVGDAETRIREDYLRILRFFRFQAWYGQSAPNSAGLAACSKLRSGLAGISAERIWTETRKLLVAPKPMPSLEAMEETGVLAQLFPNAKGLTLLNKLVALDAREGFAPDPLLRFLALFWKDAPVVHAVANQLKLSNDERRRLNWSAKDETPLSSDITPKALRASLYRSTQQVIRDRVTLEWANDNSPAWRSILSQIDTWQRPTMPITGADLLANNIPEGPQLGATLRKLESLWVKSDFQLSQSELLKHL
ncbi:MAG: CCA tRNA nucleotidyltransferase [Alphaproteobacteria bacterium]|nr:MAG: CCA tRNA nucleotidyltransferase [Alphaproteobacteria bacterium]